MPFIHFAEGESVLILSIEWGETKADQSSKELFPKEGNFLALRGNQLGVFQVRGPFFLRAGAGSQELVQQAGDEQQPGARTKEPASGNPRMESELENT